MEEHLSTDQKSEQQGLDAILRFKKNMKDPEHQLFSSNSSTPS